METIKTERSNIIEMNRGMIPPQAIDFEEAVLGAAMIDAAGLDEMMMVLKSSAMFYKEAHVYIFEAISDLFEASMPVDLLSVFQFGHLY